MKAVILAGGLGTRIAEESDSKPKPMVEIGGKPIIWHIMNYFAKFGVTDFLVATGYRGYQIKEYFANYFTHNGDFAVDLRTGEVQFFDTAVGLGWNVTVVDTGLETQTGGRLKRLEPYLGKDDFFFTYGDGLTDANLSEEINFHRKTGLIATVLAVRPPARFARLDLGEDGAVLSVQEKPREEGGWINGGYFILTNKVFELLKDDKDVFERGPLETLALRGELAAFVHPGFWMAMDTLRDRRVLEAIWADGDAPWR